MRAGQLLPLELHFSSYVTIAVLFRSSSISDRRSEISVTISFVILLCWKRLTGLPRALINLPLLKSRQFYVHFRLPASSVVPSIFFALCASMDCAVKRGLQQWLVRFENQTQILELPASDDNDPSWRGAFLELWSCRTGWPVPLLQIQCIDYPFISLRVQSRVRGGKGGFGTLLKGQSRQAGAKLTTDFGACRDLQGRRLRHVNDEIKLRKWREAQQIREQGGDEKDAMAAAFDTPSGLYNWHLMVPTWADISKKSSRKIQRQFQRMQREDEKAEQAKKEKRAQYERSVIMYVNKAADASSEAQSSIKTALQQGLQAQKSKKRKHEEEKDSSPDALQSENRPHSLCTLSGDVVVEETNKGTKHLYEIQSRSDFATLALFLDKALQPSPSKSAVVLYYEVRVVTAGLAQIGWADMTSQDFHPNTEEGEGVGDDKGSYGYDGSRGLKFHGGEEDVYGDSRWKAGDVIGCMYNLQSGEISYSLNGKDVGVAFTIPNPWTMLFPAISSNGGEILELHVGPQDMEYLAKSTNKIRVIPVQDLVAVNIADDTPSKEKPADEREQKPAAIEREVEELAAAPEEKKEEQSRMPPREDAKTEPLNIESLDLDKYEAVEDLEELGLDRLKGALVAIGVKCG